MAVPGRLRAEGRDRKIMWRGSQGAASAERHVILPDLQNEPIVFHKKLGEGGFSTVYRCAIGPLTYNSTHVTSTRRLLFSNSRVCDGVRWCVCVVGVRLCVCRCAAKVYKRTDDRIGKELVRECMIQTHLSHKNILGCLGYHNSFFFFSFSFTIYLMFFQLIPGCVQLRENGDGLPHLLRVHGPGLLLGRALSPQGGTQVRTTAHAAPHTHN
jgi:hypothetical protein